jgi:ABC-type nitrate/sulfonate/bicarbonate transport system substrate-binding protein
MLAAALALAVQVHVIVPEAHNLQDLAFWVALGAGYFGDENLEPVLDVPETPGEARKLLARPGAEAAVLPPPLYLEQIADRSPWRVVANLMQNDGINLVVRRSVAAARGLVTATAAATPTPTPTPTPLPLAQRIERLRGLKLGVAPGPRSRLRALFASVGARVEDVVDEVVLTGWEQNAAFADGKVDALYAHTPYLERALVEQDAVLVINQSAGEVPPLASRQIHTLCVTADFAAHEPARVRKLVRAIARALKLIREQPDAALAATLKAQPEAKPALVRRLVEIYRPAMPKTPAVSVEGLRAALALFPAGKVPPTLPPDLAPYVLPQFSR